MTEMTVNGAKALLIVIVVALAVMSVAGVGAIAGNAHAQATKQVNLFEAFAPDKTPPYTIVKDIDGTVNIYVVKGIGAPDKYIEVIELLRGASLGDTIVFHLNTPGGQLDTMLMLAAAIEDSSAHVVADITGGAYSAGAYIALAMDEIRMSEGSILMYHDVQIGMQAERSKMVDALVAMEKQLREFLAKHNTKGILTDAEIEGLFNGQDVYLTKGEVDARIKASKEKKERAVAQRDATGSSSVSSSGLSLGYTGSDHILSPVRYAH